MKVTLEALNYPVNSSMTRQRSYSLKSCICNIHDVTDVTAGKWTAQLRQKNLLPSITAVILAGQYTEA